MRKKKRGIIQSIVSFFRLKIGQSNVNVMLKGFQEGVTITG